MALRAAKVCSAPDCPHLQPCPTHPKVPWAGSRRRSRTISGSRQQKRAKRILRRDGGVCHWCKRPGADLVDHVIPLEEGGPDTDENLAPIHKPCHDEKTAIEAARGRQRANA